MKPVEISKNNLVRFLTFNLLFFLFTYSCAQNNIMPGYIISNDNDTINGFLKYDTDRKLSNRVVFYSDLSKNNPKIYLPDEIKEFVFSNNRIFKSIKLPGDTTSVFAKKIITGKVNFYVQKTKAPEKFFLYRSDTNKAVWLPSPKTYDYNENSKAYVYSPKKYIGLINYITDNQKTSRKLNSVNYRTKDIKKYLLSYNDEFEDSFPVSSYKDSIHLIYNIAYGMPVNFKSGELHLRASAYVDVNLTENHPNISFRAGLSYQYWHSSSNIDSTVIYNNQPWRYQVISILPVGVLFQFNNKIIIPYGYFAMGVALIINDYYFNIWTTDIFLKDRDVYFLPFTANVGLGMKVRIKKSYLFTEVTPVLGPKDWSIFLNLGFSF